MILSTKNDALNPRLADCLDRADVVEERHFCRVDHPQFTTLVGSGSLLIPPSPLLLNHTSIQERGLGGEAQLEALLYRFTPMWNKIEAARNKIAASATPPIRMMGWMSPVRAVAGMVVMIATGMIHVSTNCSQPG